MGICASTFNNDKKTSRRPTDLKQSVDNYTDHVFKIALLGPSNGGKTAFLNACLASSSTSSLKTKKTSHNIVSRFDSVNMSYPSHRASIWSRLHTTLCELCLDSRHWGNQVQPHNTFIYELHLSAATPLLQQWEIQLRELHQKKSHGSDDNDDNDDNDDDNENENENEMPEIISQYPQLIHSLWLDPIIQTAWRMRRYNENSHLINSHLYSILDILDQIKHWDDFQKFPHILESLTFPTPESNTAKLSIPLHHHHYDHNDNDDYDKNQNKNENNHNNDQIGSTQPKQQKCIIFDPSGSARYRSIALILVCDVLFYVVNLSDYDEFRAGYPYPHPSSRQRDGNDDIKDDDFLSPNFNHNSNDGNDNLSPTTILNDKNSQHTSRLSSFHLTPAPSALPSSFYNPTYQNRYKDDPMSRLVDSLKYFEGLLHAVSNQTPNPRYYKDELPPNHPELLRLSSDTQLHTRCDRNNNNNDNNDDNTNNDAKPKYQPHIVLLFTHQDILMEKLTVGGDIGEFHTGYGPHLDEEIMRHVELDDWGSNHRSSHYHNNPRNSNNNNNNNNNRKSSTNKQNKPILDMNRGNNTINGCNNDGNIHPVDPMSDQNCDWDPYNPLITYDDMTRWIIDRYRISMRKYPLFSPQIATRLLSSPQSTNNKNSAYQQFETNNDINGGDGNDGDDNYHPSSIGDDHHDNNLTPEQHIALHSTFVHRPFMYHLINPLDHKQTKRTLKLIINEIYHKQ